MKRVVGVALGLLACCSNLSAAGHLHFSNYNSPPYNQVVWDASVPVVGGFAVNNTSVQLQMWYGEGVISDENLLTPGETFTVHLALNANPYPFSGPIDYGPGGFFGPVVQVLPTYDISETFTFQLRASGNTPYGIVNESYSRSALWQETTSITYLPPSPPPPPPAAAETVPRLVVVVPEPTAFTLLGLGSLSLVMGRRRQLVSA